MTSLASSTSETLLVASATSSSVTPSSPSTATLQDPPLAGRGQLHRLDIEVERAQGPLELTLDLLPDGVWWPGHRGGPPVLLWFWATIATRSAATSPVGSRRASPRVDDPPRCARRRARGALGLVVADRLRRRRPASPEDQAEPTPSPSPSATSTPEPDADTVLAEEAAYAIAAAAVAVGAVRRDFPRLRPRLQPLARMHRAHLEVLEPSDERSVPSPEPATSPADAVARLRTVEATLQQTLVTAAVEAQSGALARLLASMSASVSQHLTTLEDSA